MENNFIQMVASAGYAVVYTIGPIHEISEMFNCWERRYIDGTYFLPQQQYSRVYALFLAFHALIYWWECQFQRQITAITTYIQEDTVKISRKCVQLFSRL